jgi:hypothetical protein
MEHKARETELAVGVIECLTWAVTESGETAGQMS